MLLFLALLLSAAAADPPAVTVRPCDSVPPVSGSSEARGGRFQQSSTIDCTVQALLGPRSEPWCLSKAQPDEDSVEVHSYSWAHENHLGGWQFEPVSGEQGAVRLRLGASSCLTAASAEAGASLSVAACEAQASTAVQAFVLDSSAQLLRLAAAPSMCLAWGSPPPSPGTYTVNVSSPRQTIWGFGFEIQSDSIGSGNNGMPNSTSSVPHDLTPSERIRFATDLLRGFRYCRLALGLFLRGLTPDKRNIVGRWPTQMAELKQMQDVSEIEGFEVEYWSPAPAWKSTQSYYEGSLLSFNASFLDNFAAAVVRDNQYLMDNGLKIAWWGLQNEPNFDNKILTPQQCEAAAEEEPTVPDAAVGAPGGYARCGYTQCNYWRAFKVAAPAVKKALPSVKIHANSARGQQGASPVALDPEARQLVDGWTWHFIGADSSLLLGDAAKLVTNMSFGIPSFENEFEYQPSQFRFNESTANTVAFVFNWLVFAEAPTFYWIHALKPTTNEESLGYGLGLWRPVNDTNMSHFPSIQPGHWDYDPYNWNAMAPFARFIPWDSKRLEVQEDDVRKDQRVFAFVTPSSPEQGGPLHAFKTPTDAPAFAIVNKDPDEVFLANFTFDDGKQRTLYGHRFNAAANDTKLPAQTGVTFQVAVPPLSAEWWLSWD